MSLDLIAFEYRKVFMPLKLLICMYMILYRRISLIPTF